MKITTYAELERVYKAFDSKNGLGFVIIKSRGGLGKTQHAKRMRCFKEQNWIGGTCTEAGMFEKFRKDPDGQFIVDDVEGLTSGKDATGKRNLLKQATQTDPNKLIARVTRTSEDEGTSVIVSNLRMIVLCNSFPQFGEDQEALLSRAHFYEFEPTNEEILKQMQPFAHDEEIKAEIKKLLPRLKLNFRHYRLAEEKKRMGLDWKAWLLSECEEVKEEVLALQLEADFKAGKITAAQRNDLWTKQTGKKYGMLRKIIRKLETKQ